MQGGSPSGRGCRGSAFLGAHEMSTAPGKSGSPLRWKREEGQATLGFPKGMPSHWPSNKRESNNPHLLRVLTLEWGGVRSDGARSRSKRRARWRMGIHAQGAGDCQFRVSDGNSQHVQNTRGWRPLGVPWASLSYGHLKCHHGPSVGSPRLGICP